MDSSLFSDLNLSPELLKALDRMGFSEMTEIQQKAIPVMMEGRDVIGKAPTGTGKTCAFGIPIIEKTDPELKQPQALILAPTRELATQICEDLKDLAHFKPGIRVMAAYGGQPIQKQIDALAKNPQVIVATPGRLMDHMNRKTIRLNHIRIVVLDEADEMLDMGFYKDVRKILDRLPKKKQMTMFSATMSREVMDISWLYQRDEVELSVQPVEDSQPKITQYAIESTGTQRILDVAEVIRQKDFKRVMIFCNTKYSTEALCYQLTKMGLDAACLNGDMPQSARNKIMADFKAGNIGILISTNVAARGIDVSDVNAVINYEIPQDNDQYLHRIGRTGRAKKAGISYLFYGPDEKDRLDHLIKFTRARITRLAFDAHRKLVLAEEDEE